MKLPLAALSALILLPAVVSPARVLPTQPAAQARTPQPNDLNGTYLCEGVRPDGAPYLGTVRIVRHESAYHLLWTVGSEEQYLGIGILNGEVLAVSYFTGAPGVVAYQIERSAGRARLVGQWTVANAEGRVFSETLTRLTPEVTVPTMPQRQPKLQPSTKARPA